MKELPIPQGENWFSADGKPSARLLYEAKHMKDFFKLQAWKKIAPPRTNWDCNYFYINPCLIRLHPVKDSSYPLGWDIQFSMDDGDRLCKKTQVWTVKLFYPDDYPYSAPITSLLDNKGHVLYGDKNQGTITIGGINYLKDCLYENHSHNPGKDHATLYAVRAIEWLRSALDSKKGGYPMRNYV